MKIIVFRDGTEKIATGEQGKYWLCGDERFRKMSKQIADVRETKAESAEEAANTLKATAAPKTKKKTEKKRKTGDKEDGDSGK